MEEDGQCKLTDFGSSKVLCAEHKTLTGTPYWMAPEVITQTGHNRFADIWSLGCTVYEISTGQPPWSDQQTGIMVLVKIVNATGPPTYPSHMSVQLQNFLNCCFQKVPSQRSNVYELLNHPFIADAPDRIEDLYAKKNNTGDLSNPD